MSSRFNEAWIPHGLVSCVLRLRQLVTSLSLLCPWGWARHKRHYLELSGAAWDREAVEFLLPLSHLGNRFETFAPLNDLSKIVPKVLWSGEKSPNVLGPLSQEMWFWCLWRGQNRTSTGDHLQQPAGSTGARTAKYWGLLCMWRVEKTPCSEGPKDWGAKQSAHQLDVGVAEYFREWKKQERAL